MNKREGALALGLRHLREGERIPQPPTCTRVHGERLSRANTLRQVEAEASAQSAAEQSGGSESSAVAAAERAAEKHAFERSMDRLQCDQLCASDHRRILLALERREQQAERTRLLDM